MHHELEIKLPNGKTIFVDCESSTSVDDRKLRYINNLKFHQIILLESDEDEIGTSLTASKAEQIYPAFDAEVDQLIYSDIESKTES